MFGFVRLNLSQRINRRCFVLITAAAVELTTAELSTSFIQSGSSTDSAVIIAAVLVPVFIIVVAVLVVFIIVYRRRRQQPEGFVFSFIILLQIKYYFTVLLLGPLCEFTCSDI